MTDEQKIVADFLMKLALSAGISIMVFTSPEAMKTALADITRANEEREKLNKLIKAKLN